MKELKSLQNIFKESIFRIPDYQRGYAWKTKQLTDFWEDLLVLPIEKKHYTGVLTIKKLSDDITSDWLDEKWLLNDRGYNAYHVVDGQQRLTTFIIFIQVLIEIIESSSLENDIYLGSFSIDEIKENYLYIEQPPKKIIRTYKFGYEVDNPSFKYLRYIILGESDKGSVQETFYTLNLSNAKSFFKENLENLISKDGLESLDLMFKKVTQNLMFNVYEISDDFDVFVAFETMNNRGKKLSNLELLKNRLIYLTTLYPKDDIKDDERESLRNEINDSWKEIYFQLGKNKKSPLNDDDFLIAHWIMYFQYTRQKGDDYIKFLLDDYFNPRNIFDKIQVKYDSVELFEEVIDLFEDDEDSSNGLDHIIAERSKLVPEDIKKYINSLKSASSVWFNIHHPLNNSELDDEEILWLDRFNRLGFVYFKPLITASFLNNSITKNDRVELFTKVEQFIFLVFRLSRALSTYRNSEFYRAARELRSGEIDTNRVIELLDLRMDYLFIEYDDSEDEYFDHSYFLKYIQRKFNTSEQSGFYGWNGLRYLLYEYEMKMVFDRGNQKLDWELFVKSENDKVSIEHILPQTLDNDCWIKIAERLDEQELTYLKGSLGNLLPLSQSINSSLQNDCFDDKKNPKIGKNGKKLRQGYSNGSHSEIEVSQLDSWNELYIMLRGLVLLRFMETRWNFIFANVDDKIELLFMQNIFDMLTTDKESEELNNLKEELDLLETLNI